jgi:hypothetical protein
MLRYQFIDPRSRSAGIVRLGSRGFRRLAMKVETLINEAVEELSGRGRLNEPVARGLPFRMDVCVGGRTLLFLSSLTRLRT